MSDRLYYSDPYLREFDATITRVVPSGNRLAVMLDRTAFYPTSGGQPFDIGTLGPFRVLEVADQEDDTIVHIVEKPSPDLGTPQPGDLVHGTIDWRRRFDHMQQHTGQHVLSAAFDRLSNVRTVSFHLGAEISTIDLAREVTSGELAAAEEEANRIVWEDRPVMIRFATAEEAARLPLRKEPARAGMLRLIEVTGFDLSACGGTHVARTGAIGIIAVGGAERFKGGSRVEFLCGGRALGRFRALRDTFAVSSRMLSAGLTDMPESIERLQADAKDLRRGLVAAETELARYRAEALAATAEPAQAARVVVRAIDGDANSLKALAASVTAKPGSAVVLVSTAPPRVVVVARSPDVSAKANEVLASLIATFGGRGGGRPELAQGGGLDGSTEMIVSKARALLFGDAI